MKQDEISPGILTRYIHYLLPCQGEVTPICPGIKNATLIFSEKQAVHDFISIHSLGIRSLKFEA